MKGQTLKTGLLFGAEDIPRIRAKMDHPRYRQIWQQISSTAQAVIQSGSLLLPGDTFTVWYYARNRLMDLSLYLLLTQEARAAQALRGILRDLCGREMDFWQGPHYPNRPRTILYQGQELLAGELETAQLAMGIAIACDWGWDWLDKETRALVLQTLEQKPKLLLRNSVRFQSEKWVMNHLCVLSAGLALLTLLQDGGDSEDLALAKRGLELWIEKIDDDGSYGEAYHYWAYPMNCLALGLMAIKQVTGTDLRGAHRLAACLPWALHNQVGKHELQGYDRPVAVAVNNYDCPYLFQMEAPETMLFAAYFKLPLAQWYIDNFLLDNPPRPDSLHHVWHTCNTVLLALDDPSRPKASPDELGMSVAAYFPDTGFVYFRDSWQNCGKPGGDTVLALQSGGGGRSRSHEHYDKNSFSLYAKGEYLICDPGHSCYRGESHRSYDTFTKAHNTLCIDGENQTLSFLEKGMLHDEAKRCTSYNNQAVVVGKNFCAELSYIASEARRCYTPALVQFTRRVWHIRPGYFLLWDRIDASNRTGEALNGFNINNYDGQTRLDMADNAITVHRPRADLQIHYLFPAIQTFRQEPGKLHLAYHILPDQAVEGQAGSAIRVTPIPKNAPPNKTDYLYLLRPLASNDLPAAIEIAALQTDGGLITQLDATITIGDAQSRFRILGEEAVFDGACGAHYVF